MNAFAGLPNPAAIGQGVLNAFDQGRARAEKERARGALAILATNPEDQTALSTVFATDPALGAKLIDRADDRAFRRDMAAMVAPGGQPNALLGVGGVTVPNRAGRPAPNALSPDASFTEAFAPVADGSLGAPERQQDAAGAAANPEALARLGEPQTSADKAFLRLVQRDPIKALKLRSAMRDNFVDQMKAESQFIGLAMGELSRAQDPGSWSAALQGLMPRAQAIGMDLSSVVPADYPGAEGVQELMRRAQPMKEQLDRVLREANIEADNDRADRNTDSMIETRESGAAERERHNRAGEGNQRRGQDLTDARVRRGQDMRGSRERIVAVKTPAEALRLPKGTKFRGPDGKVRIVP